MALTVNAGIDQTVNDATILILTGLVTPTSDPTLVSVLWTLVSGPDCKLTNPIGWVCPVLELYTGTYIFQFAATDVNGNIVSDTCSVIVSHTTGPIYNLPTTYYGEYN